MVTGEFLRENCLFCVNKLVFGVMKYLEEGIYVTIFEFKF